MDRISALIDGELDEDAARDQISRIKQNEALRECWDTFHLIRDAIRGEYHLSTRLEQRLTKCLAEEPTVLAPHRGAARRAGTYVWSMAASAAAVAVVAWVALSLNPLNPTESQPVVADVAPPAMAPLASAPTAVAVPNVPSDGNMKEYLLAHQEFSPSTVFQGVVPYIRTVSTDQPPQTR